MLMGCSGETTSKAGVNQEISAEDAQEQLKKQNVFADKQSLFTFIDRGNLEVVRLLLAAGVDPNTVLENELFTANGWTPLMLAASKPKNAEMIKLLIQAKADVNFVSTTDKYDKSLEGWNALFVAVIYGNVDNIKVLVENGADPNYVAEDRKCAIYMAARSNKAESVKALLEVGANPNINNEAKKRVPIISAMTDLTFDSKPPSKESMFNTVKALLEGGADPNIVVEIGNREMDALGWAKRKASDETVNLVQQFTKKDQSEGTSTGSNEDDKKVKYQVDPATRQVSIDENFLKGIATGKLPGIVFGIDTPYEEIHKWWGKPVEIAYNEGANAHYYNNPDIAFTENYEDTTKVAQIEIHKDFGITPNELKKLLKVTPESEGINDMSDNYDVDYIAGEYEVWFTSDTAESNIRKISMRRKPEQQ